jgi:predicted TIM-barrel fold metal-dependent hydrolase
MTTRILAHHAHVFPADVNPAGTIARLLSLLDACAIEQAVCFAPFAQHSAAGFDPNGWLAGELKNQPRLSGFGTIDFAASNFPDQVRRAVDLGFCGLKLHPNAQKFAVLGQPAREVYAAAQDADLFLTFHTGVHRSRLADCRLIDFDQIAWDYPNLRFSMEHMGGYHFFNEALAVIFNHVPPPWKPGKCRLFAGLASVFTQHQNRFWYLSPEQIKELIAQIGSTQVIFGLDFPYNLERETQMALTTLRSLGLPESDLNNILGDNLRRELSIP